MYLIVSNVGPWDLDLFLSGSHNYKQENVKFKFTIWRQRIINAVELHILCHIDDINFERVMTYFVVEKRDGTIRDGVTI